MRKEQKKRPSEKRQTSGANFIQSLLFTVDGWLQYLVWHWGEPMREFPPTKPIPPPPACLRGAPLYFFLPVKQITLGRGVKPFTTQAAPCLVGGRRELIQGDQPNKGFSMITLLDKY